MSSRNWQRAIAAQSEPLLRHALAIVSTPLAVNTSGTIAALNNFVALYREQGREGEAEELETSRKALGGEERRGEERRGEERRGEERR